jgi:hypothetical protein
MNVALSLFVIVLFVLLTPGILLRLPPKGGKYVVALVHAAVFAFVLHFVYNNYFKKMEGMANKAMMMKDAKKVGVAGMPMSMSMPDTVTPKGGLKV